MGENFSLTANVADIFNKCIYLGKIVVVDGKISDIQRLGPENPDELYVLPGFVDSHVHTESSMVAPDEFARISALNGVVAAVTDPHEIANVLGIAGVEYIIKISSSTPFHFSTGAPSCVPSTDFETSGAVLNADDVEKLLKMKEISHLSEVMNVPSVIYEDPDMMRKIKAAKDNGKTLDGHSPLLGGKDLEKYVSFGIDTDHECSSLEEAKEKLALGMLILITEGSASRHFDVLHPLLEGHEGKLMFCTDDCHPDYLAQGPIRQMVKRSISLGYDIWNVLSAACVTPVLHYNIPSGLLRKGDAADFIAVDNLKDFNVQSTYLSGIRYDNNHQLPIDTEKRNEAAIPNNFKAEHVSIDDILVKPADPAAIKVIKSNDGSLITDSIVMPAKMDGEYAVCDAERDLEKIVCLSRYEKHAKPAVGFVQGFHMTEGALASSVAHDSHNIVCVGTNDKDMVAAINAVIDMKGGLVCVSRDGISALPLPVGGIFSARPFEEVLENYLTTRETAHKTGAPFKDVFMKMSFLALPVIPWLKISDKGIFDYKSFSLTEL